MEENKKPETVCEWLERIYWELEDMHRDMANGLENLETETTRILYKLEKLKPRGKSVFYD